MFFFKKKHGFKFKVNSNNLYEFKYFIKQYEFKYFIKQNELKSFNIYIY